MVTRRRALFACGAALALASACSGKQASRPVASASGSSVEASPASVVADGSTTSTVTVTLRDASGNPVGGKAVTLSSSRGAADTISAAAGVSSASGVVTFTVSSTTAGSSTYIAVDSTDGVTVAQTAVVGFTAGAVSAARSTVASSPDSVVADGTTTSTVTVNLKDANGNPVAGKTVTLASSRGAADVISAASGPSDASGAVTFTVASTTSGTPSYTAIDETDSVTIVQTASVVFDPGPVTSAQSSVVYSPSTVVADGVATANVTVTLRDVNGNPVPGKTVTLASSRPGYDTISAASGPSDPSGVVSFTVTSTTAGAWSSYTAVDTTDGVTVTPADSAIVSWVAGPVNAAESTVTSSSATEPADGSATATITVTLKDAHGNPVSGKSVTLASSRGATDTISTTWGTSGTTGIVYFTVTSSTFGTAVFSATDSTDPLSITQTASVTFKSYLAFTAQPPASSTAGTAFGAEVALGDAAGDVDTTFHSNVTLSVNPAGVPLGGTAVVAAVSGVATFSDLHVDKAGTGYALVATDTPDGLISGTSRAFDVVPGPPSKLDFTVQPSDTGAGIGPAIQVSLEDGHGNQTPTTGSVVTVAIGSNPGGGTLTGTTAATSVDGAAIFRGLGIAALGSGYTLVATDAPDGLVSATSAAFDITSPVPIGSGTPGSCTEAALAGALAGGGNLVFDCGSSPLTITLTGQKTIGVNTSLDGGGLVTLSGGGTTPLFSVPAGVTFALSNLAIEGGMTSGNGGAISNGGTVSVTGCTLSGNGASSSNDFYGSPANGGAVFNSGGILLVAASTFSGNTVSSSSDSYGTSANGGAIYTAGGTALVWGSSFSSNGVSSDNAGYGTSASGGAIYASGGALRVETSTFAGNTAGCTNAYYGTCGNGGGIYASGAAVQVGSSTFSANSVSSDSDLHGTSADGGAIHANGGKVRVTNSTLTGNGATANMAIYGNAGNGGAVFSGGGGSVSIVSSTLSGNGVSASNHWSGTGGLGGALYGAASLTNTIVASGPSGGNCSGTFTNGGHDLDSDGTCGVGTATDPLLASAGLTGNGGPTQTIALQAGSPAIDAGDETVCAAAPVSGADQRGFARPGAGATSCSIGAFEYGSSGP